MKFRRNRETPLPRHPDNCGLQTLQIAERTREETVNEMVPDTSSPEYSEARRIQAGGPSTIPFDHYYAQAKGEYVPQTRTVKETTYLGTLTCRQMANKGIEPVKGGKGATPVIAAAVVGETVAALYCRTCPYFGKDQLQAAQYDAEVARAERDAADQLLAAELTRQEIATINQRLELPAQT